MHFPRVRAQAISITDMQMYCVLIGQPKFWVATVQIWTWAWPIDLMCLFHIMQDYRSTINIYSQSLFHRSWYCLWWSAIRLAVGFAKMQFWLLIRMLFKLIWWNSNWYPWNRRSYWFCMFWSVFINSKHFALEQICLQFSCKYFFLILLFQIWLCIKYGTITYSKYFTNQISAAVIRFPHFLPDHLQNQAMT